MASKYYNPQVARSLGAAYVEPYVSASAGVERGMKRIERMQNAQIEAKKAKAKEWEEQVKAANNNWISYNDRIQNAPNELAKLPEGPLQEYFLKEFDDTKKNFREYQSPAYSNTERSIEHQKIKGKQSNTIALIKDIPQRMLSLDPQKVSVANSPKAAKLINAQLKGEFSIDDKGMINFNDKELESIPVSKFGQIDYIPVATEKFGEKATQLDTILDGIAKNKTSPAKARQEIFRELGDLNLTREEAISITFDFFGKEQPGFINLEKPEMKNIMTYEGDSEAWIDANSDILDSNNDGDVDAGELNAWIKEQLVEAGMNAYGQYADKYAEELDEKGTGRGSKRFNDMLDLAHELTKYAPYENGVLEALKSESIGATFGGGKDITLVEGEKQAQIAALKEKGYSDEVAKKAVEDADGKNAVVFLKSTPISNFSDLLNYYNQNNYTKSNQLKFSDFNDLFNDLEPEGRELFRGQFKRTYPINFEPLAPIDYRQFKIQQ